MVQRELVYGTWFRTIDRGNEDPSAKPEGGNFIFHIEKNLADYFGTTTYDPGTVIRTDPTELTASVLSTVRTSAALKTYQLDPKTAPSGTERAVESYKRLSRGAKAKGRRATRQVTLVLAELYDTERWHEPTKAMVKKKAFRRKSCVFPAFFDNSMILQFLGCIIKQKYPLEIIIKGGDTHPFRTAKEGKIDGFDSGAWPITETEAAKGVQGASLTAAVPLEERRSPAPVELPF